MAFQATPAQQQDEARMDVLAALDREFDDDHRDQRIVLTVQKRIYARRQRIAHYCDQLGGTAMFTRHHTRPAVPLPYVAERTLR